MKKEEIEERLFLLLLLKRRRKWLALQRKRKRKHWVIPIVRRREGYREFHRLIEELRTEVRLLEKYYI